ncbi:MAG: serine/threonine-protein phosphatase [Rhodocyclales bacterium]|nr:serine/threonine-protein phosphatase [Rhodocyclales bacterium]
MASKSDAGCLRTLNEDVVRVAPDLGLLVVADGMGGHNSGEIAARLAVEVIEKRMRKALSGTVGDAALMREALRTALLDAHKRIASAAGEGGSRQLMGATVACVLLHDSRAHLAHVGDTRIYRLRGGRLELLTRDHSPAQRALEAGVVDEVELTTSHNRHLVTHALGAVAEDVISVRDTPVEPGDLFLVCSDGLNDMVDGADIELILDTLSDNLPLAAEQLVMIARDCGGHDNITVALARVDALFAAQPVPAQEASDTGKSFISRMFSWLTGANQDHGQDRT